MNEAIVIAIIAAIATIIGSGAVAAAVTAWFNRPKTAAEADKLHAEANGERAEGWQKLVSALGARIEALEKRMISTENEITTVKADMTIMVRGVEILTDQLISLEVDPAWTPPPELAARYNISTPPQHPRKPLSGRLGRASSTG